MLDRQHAGAMEAQGGGAADVARFAAQVVARLAAREGRAGPGQSEAGLQPAFLERLVSAVRSHDPLASEALKPEIRRARITAAQLADLYIPEAARVLGRGWEDDSLSFAEVTIGSARLQAILRDIGAGWAADDRPGAVRSGAATATLLMVVPEGEQHTLGALVATSQLRRMGVSVCLRIGPSARDVAALLQDRRFDAAMVSVGAQGKLEAGRRMVERLRDAADSSLRIAVGGAVTGRETGVAGLTGADIATNDLDLALADLGIRGCRVPEHSHLTAGF